MSPGIGKWTKCFPGTCSGVYMSSSAARETINEPGRVIMDQITKDLQYLP